MLVVDAFSNLWNHCSLVSCVEYIEQDVLFVCFQNNVGWFFEDANFVTQRVWKLTRRHICIGVVAGKTFEFD